MTERLRLIDDSAPLTRIGIQLRRYRTHRDSAFAIAKALRTAADTATGAEHARFAAMADRILVCARSCHVRPVTPDNAETRLVVRHPCDCKSPLCPLSNRAKSARMRRRIRDVVAYAQMLQPDAPLVFLNLTARNRPWAELAAMLDDLDAAEQRFWRLAEVKRAFLGAVTAHEIARRGTPEAPEAGAHSHVLVACHPAYFDRTAETPLYLSQQRLTELFQQSLRVDYKPIVHVARLRISHGAVGSTAIQQPLRELIKYCVKPAELFTREDDHLIADPEVIAVLARALHRRRMIRMTGLFATASRVQSRQRKEVHTTTSRAR